MVTKIAYGAVGEIKGTNMIYFHPHTDGWSIGYELVTNHMLGAPVVDEKGKFIGFISEFDLLKAIEEGRELKEIRAKDIMKTEVISVSDLTPIDEAIKLMEEKHLLNLPVVKNGRLVMTVCRHDLLRAALGVSVGVEFRRGFVA